MEEDLRDELIPVVSNTEENAHCLLISYTKKLDVGVGADQGEYFKSSFKDRPVVVKRIANSTEARDAAEHERLNHYKTEAFSKRAP